MRTAGAEAIHACVCVPVCDRYGGEWRKVRLAIDSFAFETIVSEAMVGRMQMRDGLASKRCVVYEIANEERFSNLLEK